jgi:acyl dehydratase
VSTPTLGGLSAGDAVPAITVTLTRADLVRYAGASGDLNPIHWSERTATGVGLPGVIAHGMLTMALGARLLTAWCGDPARVVDYSVRFSRPVVVPDDDRGTDLEVSGTVKKLDPDAGRAEVWLTITAQGQKVLGKSVAQVALPA